ncbi:tetratricopeptide repeat protein [Chryseobacterium geocarposphaerae]|uniref:Tetratricopeptide repeat protein n=1 Tax=Chryseobacterium geocarposphaerae TaxID=1416776 RepID=A0A2M9CA78_9FLAO|nr:tetratricopeptide repeat protein [Chryseobacterium geocarposphaerae]PJJ67766.1 tetratricopeptide repeat protein [Chryseobacterium geocarposphaerae]
MKKIFLLLVFYSGMSFSQNYLDNGNVLISENKFSEAENVFREGLKHEPDNLIFKSQLALTLIKQNKNDQAEKVIVEVLKKDPSFPAALWYGGINNFSKKKSDFRKAISYFEKSYNLIDKHSKQYFAVNFYLGKSYQNLLYTEGLSYDEVDRMIETYKKYIELQPDAENIINVKSFVEKIENNRPGRNVEKWVITTNPNVVEVIKKELNGK